MKQFFIVFIALGLSVGFMGCEEEGIDELIDFSEFVPVDDTAYIDLDTLANSEPQEKNVYIEDFTGVQCSNCPDAAKRIKSIKEAYPGRVVSMAIHAGADNFVQPKAGHSTYFFVTKEGNNIAGMLGASGSLPEGTVERVKYESEEKIITSRLTWSGQTDQRITETTPVNIDFVMEKKEENSFTFLVRVLYNENVDASDAHFLAVYLNENDLVDYQYDIIKGDIEDYHHEHVFRKSLTKFDGDSLKVSGESNPYMAGRVFQRRFTVTVKEDAPGETYRTGWNMENLGIVAFVHKKTAEDYEVLHVKELLVKE